MVYLRSKFAYPLPFLLPSQAIAPLLRFFFYYGESKTERSWTQKQGYHKKKENYIQVYTRNVNTFGFLLSPSTQHADEQPYIFQSGYRKFFLGVIWPARGRGEQKIMTHRILQGNGSARLFQNEFKHIEKRFGLDFVISM